MWVGRSLDQAIGRVKLADGLGFETAYVTHINGRESLTLLAAYAGVTDSIRLNSELLYGHSESVEPFNQPIFNAPVFGGNSASLRFSTSNPFLPAATRAAIIAQPTPLPVDPLNAAERIFFLSRSSADIGNNRTSSESDTYRGVFGAEGDFEVLGRGLNWDISANFGETKGTFRSPNIDHTHVPQDWDSCVGSWRATRMSVARMVRRKGGGV